MIASAIAVADVPLSVVYATGEAIISTAFIRSVLKLLPGRFVPPFTVNCVKAAVPVVAVLLPVTIVILPLARPS